MVLEATVMCVDNSEWMRNGDYTPSRLEAQADAVNLLCNAKTQSNPENTVGVIACAGKSPEVLVTLTSDLGKILTALHDVKITTRLNFVSGVQVAQLALKHRQNKNQHQRVIFFVGSPIENETTELVRLGNKLKKNNIAVDIVNFGEESNNTDKLEAFIQAVSNNDNSHLVTVPPGPHILSDILISSPIITGGEEGGAGVRSDFGFGVDPNMDPELALALKVSMEEERARQEAARKKEEAERGGAPETPANSATSGPTSASSRTEVAMSDVDEEERLLAEAIAMSMQENRNAAATPATSGTATSRKDTDKMDVDEDDEMALALQMSMQENKPKASSADINRAMEDPNFINSVLSRLPGVDPNDDRIKNVLASIGKTSESEKKDEDKEKK
eukprot:TRINITY_DN980_c0_g1_i1.p1 TRINITY_DN980_c0_g1~~TRINITY_DN980_c0_g1_i1.p1  ORF type:complete len:389 (-),score=127.08 TRINITY_DN980_c0_g1_i1:130-1296(-)